ncbi:MAG: cache domain-containing protein [Desulfobacula sp.]|uniref:cache domain-containing protein n=1 Tax=Desulfobacula sp. TaxID=2593537 RepID=UPI0025C661AF|nr:cache domain-containing protein [Desulfobacula sp.]MCD4721160.1 cache domain-containing protein [Desulfobacula sp.]
MGKKINFIKFIQLWGIILLIVVGAIIIVLDIIVSYRDFYVQADQIRADYIVQQKRVIKQEVDRVVAMINHEKAKSETITKEKIKSRVYEAYAIAQHIYQQNKTAKTKAEIKQMILDALRPIRFADKSGYYFATRLDGVEILFADKPELEGENLLNLQDTHGQYVIKEMIEIVRQSREGFYEYYWTKPNAKGRNFKKISFVKRFEPFDWFIGTGLYVDDVEMSIKKKIMGQINKIRFGINGYIFVDTWQGISLAHGLQPDLIGTNMWETEDSRGNKTTQMLVAASKKEEGGYVSYWWRKSSTIKESPKIAYTKSIPDWEILVGTGAYLDDVEIDIALMHTKLNNQIKTKMFSFALIVIGVIVFVLFFFNRLTHRIKNDFNLFVSFFNRAAYSDEAINRDKVHFVELDRMAQNANQMLRDKILARQELMDEREQLKQSEHFLNSIFESIQDGISVLNPDLTIRHTNGVMKKWYALDLPLEGKKCFTCYQNIDEPCDPCPTLRCLESERMEMDIIPGPPESDEVKWVELYSYPIKNAESGEITGIVEFVRDITKQKKTEEELQKMEKLKSVGTLAGGIAHDFNNILMGLFGNISLAKEDLNQEHPAFKALEGAESSMNRATRLTRQLLTFARGGEPVKKNVTLGTLVEEVVRFDLSGSNVKPVFEQVADLWLADVDKGQIQQVFSNLTINANQAMPDGGNLYIILKNEELFDKTLAGLNPGKYIKVIVRDEGAGIEQKYLERIFDPYFTTKQTGSGLGLATVYSIVNKHGGRISVDSKLGQGSIFTLYLPASEARQLPQTGPVAAKSSSLLQSARVLIMDDEKMICDVASKMLEKSGYEVKAVEDGRQAIVMYQQALASKRPFDVVIMDLTIPGGMGGEEAIREILAFDPEVKAIVSSGYADDRIMANYAEYGFKDIVSKPYSICQLREVLNRVLKG